MTAVTRILKQGIQAHGEGTKHQKLCEALEAIGLGRDAINEEQTMTSIESKPRFYIENRRIFQRGREQRHEHGSRTMELDFPICDVTEYVTETGPGCPVA